MKIAFIGLGVMGGPMAGHLLSQYDDLIAYNRTANKALTWHDAYPTASIASDLSLPQNQSVSADRFDFTSLKEVIQQANIIVSCIGKDSDVSELSDEITLHGKPGLIWVDHTTVSASISIEIYQKLKEKEIGFIDAPVSGGDVGAQKGTLTTMCGGDKAIFEKITPLLKAYCKQTTLVGPSGHGQLTKMVNQICLVNILQGLSEGLHFAKKVGLNAEKVINAISKGGAQSWQMDNRAHTMIKKEFDFGFAVDLVRKDLGICFKQAEQIEIPLPLTRQIDALYEKIQADGYGRLDTSALIKQFDN